MIVPVSQSQICVDTNSPKVDISRPKHSSTGVRRYPAEVSTGWFVHQHPMHSSCSEVQFQAMLNARVHLETAPKDPQYETGITQ